MNLLVVVGRPLATLALTLALASAVTGCKYLKRGGEAEADAAVAVVEEPDAGDPAVDEDDEDEEEAVADAGAAAKPKVAAKPTEAVPGAVDDEKMVSQVTKSTYKAELDRVEKDVDGEK